MDAIISAKDLVFSYPGDARLALDHVSLTVGKGDLVAVLGHNGSGKSTLAKHFNAILLPQGGVCYVDGINTADEDRLLELRSRAGMVFQNPDNQIVATIVEEDVAFGLENIGVPPEEIRIRVDEALTDVGMHEYRLHAPHQLSGGQKQRVAIAGIIAMMPKLIILDEPTAMLDPRGRAEVLETVIKLNREFGVTVLLITHFMDEAAACRRVVVMDDGKILLDAPPKEVFSHVSLLKQVGLDVPQATEIIHELRRSGINLPDDIITDEECVEALSSLLASSGKGGGWA
ncbi:energy-coupling factor transporter ATP-binding protein EcfA [Eubacteriales bacterium]|nr:energy-coupling factor transporter ATPase [Oscillospiraceae bacterium]MCM0705267.1 energy-coupling factor transporter ATPase [Faecalicatena sp. BF-R-105]GKH51623.1 energy-coupling factor transporter ATP-binding protein EcfA [Eubacteriales bacterium]GKH64342.1 energy-coupling factor transporter ATP-binding protein EcfA [Eubacteriales bacterium]